MQFQRQVALHRVAPGEKFHRQRMVHRHIDRQPRIEHGGI